MIPSLEAKPLTFRANDQAVWPWQAEPFKLWSLLDMIGTFSVQNFGAFAGNFERAIVWAEMIMNPPPDVPKIDLLNKGKPEYAKAFEGLLRAAPDVPLSYPITRMIERFGEQLRLASDDGDHLALCELARTLRQALMDDLASHVFLSVEAPGAAFYSQPLAGWDAPIERFGCAFDIEEGRKCFALGRYTAAVFHLMKVVEAAVLELQVFLEDTDVKAHFGSVLSKLENMTQKTKFEHVPESLRPYLPFMRDAIVQLHAVKDSWRNKVSHVDARIVPTDTFTEELAKSVHDATLSLMNKLASGMPPKEVA